MLKISQMKWCLTIVPVLFIFGCGKSIIINRELTEKPPEMVEKPVEFSQDDINFLKLQEQENDDKEMGYVEDEDAYKLYEQIEGQLYTFGNAVVIAKRTLDPSIYRSFKFEEEKVAKNIKKELGVDFETQLFGESVKNRSKIKLWKKNFGFKRNYYLERINGSFGVYGSTRYFLGEMYPSLKELNFLSEPCFNKRKDQAVVFVGGGTGYSPNYCLCLLYCLKDGKWRRAYSAVVYCSRAIDGSFGLEKKVNFEKFNNIISERIPLVPVGTIRKYSNQTGKLVEEYNVQEGIWKWIREDGYMDEVKVKNLGDFLERAYYPGGKIMSERELKNSLEFTYKRYDKNGALEYELSCRDYFKDYFKEVCTYPNHDQIAMMM